MRTYLLVVHANIITVSKDFCESCGVAHWLGVLKADKRAIFTAASKAVQSVAFLWERTP
jgi:antirestriction protein ArdC